MHVVCGFLPKLTKLLLSGVLTLVLSSLSIAAKTQKISSPEPNNQANLSSHNSDKMDIITLLHARTRPVSVSVVSSSVMPLDRVERISHEGSVTTTEEETTTVQKGRSKGGNNFHGGRTKVKNGGLSMAVSIIDFELRNGKKVKLMQIASEGDRFPLRIGLMKIKKIMANAEDVIAKLREEKIL